MSGYAASRRIEHVTVHVGRADIPLRLPDAAALGVSSEDVDVVAEDLVGRPLDVVLEERWASIRETWSQTTFYLFDPEGWR